MKLNPVHRRNLVFSALYLCEGGPIGFIWWALPTQLREANLPIEQITTLTSLCVIPWLLKFLWAPLVDVLRNRRWGHRHWIVACQATMGLTLLPLAFLDYRQSVPILAVVLPVHALAAATQDVAIDAWAIRITPEQDRGRLSGAMQAGMLTGRWLWGAGVLLLGAAVAQPFVIATLVTIIWSSAFVVALCNDPPPTGEASQRTTAFIRSLREVFSSRNTWLGLGFALAGGAAFEGIGAVAGPFLIDRGLGSEAVGGFYSSSVIATLLGSAGGGWLADRVGRRRSTAFFLVLLASLAAGLGTVDHYAAPETDSNSLVVFLLAVYLAIGLFTAASYALFMDLTDASVAGTQFSAYMGATNACESWSAFAVGRLIPAWGYGAAFAAMGGLSLLALPLLPAMSLRKRLESRPVNP